MLSQINLHTGKCEEMFSFNHQGWVDQEDSNGFLTTLLNLPFYPVMESQRRKIGLPPGHNKPDRRPLWNPKTVYEGQLIPQVAFLVWKAKWPYDGTDLSRKNIEIYLPHPDFASSFSLPTYFPYWIEVEGKIGSAKVRVIDSGHGAISPRGALPHRPPTFIGQRCSQEGVELFLETSLPAASFNVIAEDTNSFGKIFPLPIETFKTEGGICLFVSIKDLTELFEPNSSYIFQIISSKHPYLSIHSNPLCLKDL